MTTILCRTDCPDHDYFFPHSLIRTTRIIKREIVVTEMIVCRECGHWIDNRAVRCACRYHCHEEEGGTIVQTALIVIHCL
jgi:hypothetical protein